MLTVMCVPYGGEVEIQPDGPNLSVVRVRFDENVVVLVLHDTLLRQLEAKANDHLNRRAAEQTLAMMETERERRLRGEQPEALAVMTEVSVTE